LSERRSQTIIGGLLWYAVMCSKRADDWLISHLRNFKKCTRYASFDKFILIKKSKSFNLKNCKKKNISNSEV
jgi:hypothetical protein